MISISEQSIVSAWRNGLKHLLQRRDSDYADFHLVLGIQKPLVFSTEDKVLLGRLDSLLKRHDRSIETVAGTIFPGAEYRQFGARGVYEIYPEQSYPLIKPDNPWGTYAHRLVRQTAKGETINPLQTIVEKMKNEFSNKGPKRACYELSVTEPVADIAMFANETDLKRTMGGPCLSHVSFKLDPRQKVVHLASFYRSHFYIERALGNLLGLARLQYFVAKEVGVSVGELLCISSYAKLEHAQKDAPWKLSEVAALLDAEKSKEVTA